MSYKKGQDYDNMEDMSSDYESESEPETTNEQSEEIAVNVREALFEYIKETALPIAEFLTIENMELFIEHTLNR